MEGIVLRPADIVCTRGRGKLAGLIRFFTRRVGESRSQVNHVGVIVVGGPISAAVIVEALSSVVRRRLVDGYTGKAAGDVAIFRPVNLEMGERWKIASTAMDYVGRKYGALKILAHLGDWLLQGAYVFRRIAGDDNYPICSWLVAHSFATAGRNFGVSPGAASPDDIWDFCTSNPDKYECVVPLGNLNRFLKGEK
jgi:hypothetical protein